MAITEDDEKWFSLLSREKFLRDQISKEYYWKNEVKKGEKRGISIGKKEGKIETAKNMLNLGIDINIISQSTNLTKEEILTLKSE